LLRPILIWVLTYCYWMQQSICVAADSTSPVAVPIQLPGVENAFQVTTNLWSGSHPEGDAAFAALARLGVKTIVSVDGVRPDVATAHKFGLRYIHLPFGYDGIPTNRVAELTEIAGTEAGTLYVHCHHGRHRGPAAVAVMCLSHAGWSPNLAGEWLEEAGTSRDYPGLWRAVTHFTMPSPMALQAVTNLPEVVESSSMVTSMVAIDTYLEHLGLAQQSGWKSPPQHPGIYPPHEATLLWEQFRELARTDDALARTEAFRVKLAKAEQQADELRQALQNKLESNSADTRLKQLRLSCADCHRQYRNQ